MAVNMRSLIMVKGYPHRGNNGIVKYAYTERGLEIEPTTDQGDGYLFITNEFKARGDFKINYKLDSKIKFDKTEKVSVIFQGLPMLIDLLDYCEDLRAYVDTGYYPYNTLKINTDKGEVDFLNKTFGDIFIG